RALRVAFGGAGGVGAAIVAVVTLAAVFAPWVAAYDPVALNPPARLQGPSAENLLGTDQYGRDTLSRIVYGGRASLAVAGARRLAALRPAGARRARRPGRLLPRVGRRPDHARHRRAALVPGDPPRDRPARLPRPGVREPGARDRPRLRRTVRARGGRRGDDGARGAVRRGQPVPRQPRLARAAAGRPAGGRGAPDRRG